MSDDLRHLSGIHKAIANDVWDRDYQIVWCEQCGRIQKVDPAHCLAHGWPECCGYTMPFGELPAATTRRNP